MSIEPSARSLGSIGAGNMARALIGGMIDAGLIKASQSLASDPDAGSRERFTEATGVRTTDDNAAVARQCDVLLLAVKPQTMAIALDSLAKAIEPRHCILSIAAGIATTRIEERLGQGVRVVRAMPNTPALIGCGAAAVAPGANASDDDMALARSLLQAVGICVQVHESQMDAVTALSGSGPAYFFHLVEHLIAAGVEQGLSAQDAEALAKQTALGAARMMIERPETPEQLRVAVTSPGGATAAALSIFEQRDTGAIVRQAVAAATRRGRELGAN